MTPDERMTKISEWAIRNGQIRSEWHSFQFSLIGEWPVKTIFS